MTKFWESEVWLFYGDSRYRLPLVRSCIPGIFSGLVTRLRSDEVLVEWLF